MRRLGAGARKGGAVIHFLCHDKHDSVGVAVVDLKAGQSLQGRSLDTNDTHNAKANMDIPLGHNIAMKDLKVGETWIKYVNDISTVLQPIKAGDHVHVHNVKTKRWS